MAGASTALEIQAYGPFPGFTLYLSNYFATENDSRNDTALRPETRTETLG